MPVPEQKGQRSLPFFVACATMRRHGAPLRYVPVSVVTPDFGAPRAVTRKGLPG
jgi:hypothetical protein